MAVALTLPSLPSQILLGSPGPLAVAKEGCHLLSQAQGCHQLSQAQGCHLRSQARWQQQGWQQQELWRQQERMA